MAAESGLTRASRLCLECATDVLRLAAPPMLARKSMPEGTVAPSWNLFVHAAPRRLPARAGRPMNAAKGRARERARSTMLYDSVRFSLNESAQPSPVGAGDERERQLQGFLVTDSCRSHEGGSAPASGRFSKSATASSFGPPPGPGGPGLRSASPPGQSGPLPKGSLQARFGRGSAPIFRILFRKCR